MNTLLLTVLATIGYLAAYRTYGKFLSEKIFKLNRNAVMPSAQFNDGIDFVPTRKSIVFGHHFTTIAGLGPIVGPAIGIIWGWLPAFIWVFVGSIFMGAFHDFATLVMSSRNKGKSIGELTGDLINPSARFAFQFIIQFLLFIVLSVFAMIVGVLFEMYPEAVFPVWLQIPIAVWLGWMIRKGKNDILYSVIAVILMYASIIAGIYIPVKLPPVMGSPVVTWCLVLFVYVFFASTIPVQKLLQPRDYINSNQLFIAMILLVLAIIVVHPVITAPAINHSAFSEGTDIPDLMPLLFITIACGAISGFHSLASSGTTVRQVENEKDTLFIGYGGMIWESFLALLVLMAIAGGLGMGMTDGGVLYSGIEAFKHHYTSWNSANGMSAQLNAFVTGAANLYSGIGIPKSIGTSIIAVFIVSFANTTLDSAARIQRFSLQEIMKTRDDKIMRPFNNRYFSTFVIVLLAAAMAFIKPGASGALILWPLFGALNQLLAALALGMVTIYLRKNKVSIYYSLIPMIFILFMTLWASFQNLIGFYKQGDWVLFVISFIILLLTFWLIVVSLPVFMKKKVKIAATVNS